MSPSRWVTGCRIIGIVLALASSVGGILVVQLLYTGRGGETPIRSAMLEQPLVVLLGLCGFALGLFMAISPESILAARPWLNPKWVWRERKPEFFLLIGSTCTALLILDLGSRALYAAQRDFPFFYPTEHLVYPPLHEQFHDYTDEGTNVLLLGGSVLYFAARENEIESALDEPVRVYNLAQTAHSTLDSLTKYQYALNQGYRCDYVIFYHGINEVRANNVPPELFSEQYNHYFFYRLTNTVFGDRNPTLRVILKSALAFRIERLITQLRETRFFGRHLVHMAFPREDWLQYGSDLRSRAVFERNLLEIARLAESEGSTLLVPRFAYHPALDDVAAGRDTELDMPRFTEHWGLPENVHAGIQAHNEVILAYADRYHYLDTSEFQHEENFVDPCHFTAEAQTEFAELLAATLEEMQTVSP